MLRFPLSMGELRDDADHTGAACHVIDVLFNIAVVRCQVLTMVAGVRCHGHLASALLNLAQANRTQVQVPTTAI